MSTTQCGGCARPATQRVGNVEPETCARASAGCVCVYARGRVCVCVCVCVCGERRVRAVSVRASSCTDLGAVECDAERILAEPPALYVQYVPARKPSRSAQ